jgi:imidazolonepropionase-like amidohydrolase
MFRPLAVAAVLSSLAVPAPAAGRLALVGGTLIDGFGSTPIRNSVVLIEGEKITAVGQVGTLEVPGDAELISTEGMSVLPGLWDMHVHLMLSGHADYGHWDATYRDRLASEIMPATAHQLLLAGVTSARDLGAPLDASLEVRERIRRGEIPGPTLYVSGPFIQKRPYPGTGEFRWGVDGPEDARAKVRRLADAGVDVIKLIDQDQMSPEEVQAVVDEAHAHDLPVVAHSHRPEEIRRGLAAGIDVFEHTGQATAPEYPADVMEALRARTAAGSPLLFWTPTVSVLWNFPYMRDWREMLDDPSWKLGLQPDTIADIEASLRHPDRFPYFRMVPARGPTLRRKFAQIRESGVVLLVGTDSGVPMLFHSQSTWNELDVWVRELGVDPMDAIRAASFWPAVAMGVEDEVGTVSEGKYADVIAVRGDVLRHIDRLQDVDVVVRHGVRYR